MIAVGLPAVDDWISIPPVYCLDDSPSLGIVKVNIIIVTVKVWMPLDRFL